MFHPLQEFWEKREFAGLALDGDNTEKLTRLLDSCAIILEGGTDFDLKILDMVEEKAEDAADKKKDGAGDKDKSDAASAAKDKGAGAASAGDEQSELQKKAKEYLEAKSGGDEDDKAKKGKKRKRRGSGESGDDGSDVSSDDEDEAPPGMKDPEEKPKEANGDEEEASKENGDKKEEEKPEAAEDDEDAKMEEDAEKKGEKEKEAAEEAEDDSGPKPRALHKTSSIFLRNLAPTITMQEVSVSGSMYVSVSSLKVCTIQYVQMYNACVP